MKVTLLRLLHATLKRWPEWVVAFGLGMLLGLGIAVKSNERLIKEAAAKIRASCEEPYMPYTVTIKDTPPSVVPPESKRSSPTPTPRRKP